PAPLLHRRQGRKFSDRLELDGNRPCPEPPCRNPDFADLARLTEPRANEGPDLRRGLLRSWNECLSLRNRRVDLRRADWRAGNDRRLPVAAEKLQTEQHGGDDEECDQPKAPPVHRRGLAGGLRNLGLDLQLVICCVRRPLRRSDCHGDSPLRQAEETRGVWQRSETAS